MSSGGKITLLPSLEAGEMFAVLAHEVAHELLHQPKNGG
jgi:predicted SprT family Zn-dependent metalloprotease